MNYPVLSLTCLATLTAGSAMAMDVELQQGHDDVNHLPGSDLLANIELLNKAYDDGVVRNDDVTAHGHITGRIYDIGAHFDTWMAVGSGAGPGDPNVTTGEVVKVSGKLDYLMEMTTDIGDFQFLPHYEFDVYPNVSGSTRNNWLGLDVWYLFPLQEGIEFGASIDYNLHDDESGSRNEHAWRGAIGSRQFYQDAPFDLFTWQLVNFGNRRQHEVTSGTDKQGVTYFTLGGKITMPLPWEEGWAFFRLEGNWWLTKEDRDAFHTAGQSSAEVIISVGLEYRFNE